MSRVEYLSLDELNGKFNKLESALINTHKSVDSTCWCHLYFEGRGTKVGETI